MKRWRSACCPLGWSFGRSIGSLPRGKEVRGMTQLDSEFFEEYKHLERLRSD